MRFKKTDSYHEKRAHFVKFIYEHTFAGNKLPKEAEIASLLGVSLGQVRELLRYMESKGDITKKRATGNFINYSSIDAKQRIDCNEDFMELISETGRKPSLIKRPRQNVSDKYEAFIQTYYPASKIDEFTRLDNVYLGDDQPLVYAMFFFPSNISMADEVVREEKEVYWDYYKAAYHHSLIQFEVGLADDKIAEELLLAPKTPILIWSEAHYDSYDALICVSKSYFQPDVMHFTMVRK